MSDQFRLGSLQWGTGVQAGVDGPVADSVQKRTVEPALDMEECVPNKRAVTDTEYCIVTGRIFGIGINSSFLLQCDNFEQPMMKLLFD